MRKDWEKWKLAQKSLLIVVVVLSLSDRFLLFPVMWWTSKLGRDDAEFLVVPLVSCSLLSRWFTICHVFKNQRTFPFLLSDKKQKQWMIRSLAMQETVSFCGQRKNRINCGWWERGLLTLLKHLVRVSLLREFLQIPGKETQYAIGLRCNAPNSCV